MQNLILTTIAIILVVFTVYVYYGNMKNTSKINTVTLKKNAILNREESVEKKKNLAPSKTHINKIMIDKKIEDIPEIPILLNNEEIIPGEDITLEDIENSDASEEEKKRMMDDMLYFQSLHMKIEPTLNEYEIQRLIENDIEQGLFNKK